MAHIGHDFAWVCSFACSQFTDFMGISVQEFIWQRSPSIPNHQFICLTPLRNHVCVALPDFAADGGSVQGSVNSALACMSLICRHGTNRKSALRACQIAAHPAYVCIHATLHNERWQNNWQKLKVMSFLGTLTICVIMSISLASHDRLLVIHNLLT